MEVWLRCTCEASEPGFVHDAPLRFFRDIPGCTESNIWKERQQEEPTEYAQTTKGQRRSLAGVGSM